MAVKKINKENMDVVNTPQAEVPKTETKEEISNPLPKKNIKYVAFIIIAVIAIVTFVFLTLNKSEKTENETAATVNGKVITLNELNKIYDSLPAQYKLTTNKESILNQLIEVEVLYQEAKKDGIVVPPEKAENYITLAKTSSGLTEEQFAQKLAEQNITEEQLIEQYTKQLAIQEFLNKTLFNTVTVTDEEVKEFYNENKNNFKVGEQATVKHILIGDSTMTPEEQEEKANSLLKEITTANFCEYVKNYSADKASIENCGEYTFAKDDPLVQEFKDLSFKQATGKIGTVKTQFGTHIIWTVKKTQPKTLLLKDVQDQIKTTLTNQQAQERYTQFYGQLKQNSNIEIKYVESAVNTEISN